jgi:hypothetical protein
MAEIYNISMSRSPGIIIGREGTSLFIAEWYVAIIYS